MYDKRIVIGLKMEMEMYIKHAFKCHLYSVYATLN